MPNPSILPPLQRAVLATVAALDAFDFAPNDRDVWRWLFAVRPDTAGPAGGEPFGLELPATYDAVAETLSDLVGARKLSAAEGRYFLPHREELLAVRASRVAAAPRKWSRARYASAWLRSVPFVEMVAVCNNAALDNAAPEADVDLFIVLRDGHLWLGRALVTAMVHALGLRRHGTLITDRMCLSFFISAAAVDLTPLAQSPADPYLALWVAQVVPVLDSGGAFDRFRKANAWVERILPNAFAEAREDQRVRRPLPLEAWQRLAEQVLTVNLYGPPLEAWARSRQRARMSRNWWSRAKAGGTDVVISDVMLKFHESDRRGLYREKIAERVSKVLT